MAEVGYGWAGICECKAIRAATMETSGGEDVMHMDIGRMITRGLRVERRKLPIQLTSCTCKLDALRDSEFSPIDYSDWRAINRVSCEVCEGSGKQGGSECPICLSLYKQQLAADRVKWKLHTENPAFFVTAEAASKIASYHFW